jgi:hypothetical protein
MIVPYPAYLYKMGRYGREGIVETVCGKYYYNGIRYHVVRDPDGFELKERERLMYRIKKKYRDDTFLFISARDFETAFHWDHHIA